MCCRTSLSPLLRKLAPLAPHFKCLHKGCICPVSFQQGIFGALTLITRGCMVWWSGIQPLAFLPSNRKEMFTVKKRLKFDHLSTLCVGLDIGSRGNFITALNFDSDRLINMRPVPNTASGVEAMESMILAVLEKNPQFRYLLIALESTSFYGVHVANYLLSTSAQLKPYDIKVFCLNPKTIANYRKSFTGLGKNDGIDSFLVANYVRAGRIEIDPWRGSQYLAQQRLTRQRRHISEAIAREKNYVLNNVFLKFSEFALLSGEDSPVSNKFSVTAEALPSSKLPRILRTPL